MSGRLLLLALLLIAFGEIFVRLFVASPVATRPDEELGWTYLPYAEIFHTKEGWARNRMNSLGFNDREPGHSAAQHVLVVGDSFTEALHVRREENFSTLVERALPGYDVFNAGRSGLSPVHYPVLVRRLAPRVDADLVVLVITSGDLEDIERGDFQVVRDSEGRIATISPREQARSKMRDMLDPLLLRSALATHLMERARSLRFENSFVWSNSAVASPSKREGRPSAPDKEEILEYVFSVIRKQVPLRAVYIPRLHYLENRKAVETDDSVNASRLIASVAEKVDVPFATATDSMIERYRVDGQPPVGFHNNNVFVGHLNERGHQAVATVVTGVLSSRN